MPYQIAGERDGRMVEEQEWVEEERRLERVEALLQERIGELEPLVGGLREQASELRKRFWEEVTVNASTPEDFEETFYSIRQQEALLSERERSHQLRRRQWNSLKRLAPSPYFGRIDVQEAGQSGEEAIYIGVASLLGTDEMSFLIYDWRTPVAGMYYDYSPGPCAYETPGGERIEGTMKRKRQYRIRDGRLLDVFDTGVTIGDELLQQVLGQDADNRMRSIVATIQREQNAIIRDDHSRLLVVQGAAGSGKTSAALQRVAYLLYKHRDRLRADQIVLFSPNPLFNSYVSTVLPELGEENMQQTTFQEYLEYGLGKQWRMEDPFDQMEYLLTAAGEPGHEARLAGIRYKASEAYLEALQGYADRLAAEGMCFLDLRLDGRVLIGADEMAARFYAGDASVRLPNRIALLREWLLRRLGQLERKEREASWVEEELDYLDKDQYDAVSGELLRKYRRDRPVFDFTTEYLEAYGELEGTEQGEAEVFDFAEQEEELLRKLIVHAKFKPLRRQVRRLSFVDAAGLYARLFTEEASYRTLTGAAGVPGHWPEICAQTLEKLEQGGLFHEDATPFLYLKELVEGVRTNTEVRHLFVDEGQDYSAFQYRFLRRLFPRARMTVLGDFGQAIFAQSTNLNEADSPLLRLYGEADTRIIELLRSYRSTREIVEFTRALLPGGEGIIPFDRSGGKPCVVRRTGAGERNAAIAADLAALESAGFGSVAVITKTAAESREALEALANEGREDLRLVTKETLAFEKGTVVIPAYLAKGIEFDAVLIYNASPAVYGRESERKLFYTACTRAMHRLLLYTDGDWTPLLDGVSAELYESR